MPQNNRTLRSRRVHTHPGTGKEGGRVGIDKTLVSLGVLFVLPDGFDCFCRFGWSHNCTSSTNMIQYQI